MLAADGTVQLSQPKLLLSLKMSFINTVIEFDSDLTSTFSICLAGSLCQCTCAIDVTILDRSMVKTKRQPDRGLDEHNHGHTSERRLFKKSSLIKMVDFYNSFS
jgi:hypothetical protein